MSHAEMAPGVAHREFVVLRSVLAALRVGPKPDDKDVEIARPSGVGCKFRTMALSSDNVSCEVDADVLHLEFPCPPAPDPDTTCRPRRLLMSSYERRSGLGGAHARFARVAAWPNSRGRTRMTVSCSCGPAPDSSGRSGHAAGVGPRLVISTISTSRVTRLLWGTGRRGALSCFGLLCSRALQVAQTANTRRLSVGVPANPVWPLP